MIETAQDTQPLSNFSQNPAEVVAQLRATLRPITLTVGDGSAVVIQDAAAYQRLLDIAALADPKEGTRQGLADVAAGRTRPAREVFDEFRQKHRIPR